MLSALVSDNDNDRDLERSCSACSNCIQGKDLQKVAHFFVNLGQTPVKMKNWPDKTQPGEADLLQPATIEVAPGQLVCATVQWQVDHYHHVCIDK